MARVWIYSRLPKDYHGTIQQQDFLKLKAELAGDEIVGCSFDTSGNFGKRKGYHTMMQHLSTKEIDTIYLCTLSAISDSDRQIYLFLRQLMRRNVKVKTFSISIEDSLKNRKSTKKIQLKATKKELELPW